MENVNFNAVLICRQQHSETFISFTPKYALDQSTDKTAIRIRFQVKFKKWDLQLPRIGRILCDFILFSIWCYYEKKDFAVGQFVILPNVFTPLRM